MDVIAEKTDGFPSFPFRLGAAAAATHTPRLKGSILRRGALWPRPLRPLEVA